MAARGRLVLSQLLGQQLHMLRPDLLPAGLRGSCQALLPGLPGMEIPQLRHRVPSLGGPFKWTGLAVCRSSPASQLGAAGHWVATGTHSTC